MLRTSKRACKIHLNIQFPCSLPQGGSAYKEVCGIMQKLPIDDVKYTPSHVVASAPGFSKFGVRAVQKFKHVYAKSSLK